MFTATFDIQNHTRYFDSSAISIEYKGEQQRIDNIISTSKHEELHEILERYKIEEEIIYNQQELSSTTTFLDEIRHKIFEKINFPKEWEEEQIAKPNLESKTKAFEICKFLLEKHSLYPDRIAPTKEEGVFLSYNTESKNKSLIIEIYNNLEVAAIVTNNKLRVVEYSEDIYGFQLSNAVNTLNKQDS